MDKLKILITTGLYPPEIGGPATYTVLLEKELPKKGYEVKVLPFRRSRHLPKFIRHAHFFFLILKEAREVDLLFAQDVLSVGFPTLLASRLLRKRFFVRVPGDYAWEQASQRYGVVDSIDDFQHKKYGLKVELMRKLQTIVTKYADGVVTPSEYFKHLVGGWGVSANKIHPIYNGVNLSAITPSTRETLTSTIVTAGRLVPWKGFDTVISLLTDLPNWRLVILGSGPEESNLRALVKELNLENRVTFAGQVSREEVSTQYQTADVFVLNTGFESFSYQVVEAMLAGIPIITTNVGSLPELITNGTDGVLIDKDDKEAFLTHIKSIVTDRELWQKRVDSSRQKAGRFSLETTMNNLDILLKTK